MWRGTMAHGGKRMVRRGTDPRRQLIHVSWWAAKQRVGRAGWSRFPWSSRKWTLSSWYGSSETTLRLWNRLSWIAVQRLETEGGSSEIPETSFKKRTQA